MELGERVLVEGGNNSNNHTHWNPGITQVSVPQQQGQQSDAWPPMQQQQSASDQCLMNVVNNSTAPMFGVGGGYPLILSSSDGGGVGHQQRLEFASNRIHRFPSISTHSHFIPSSSSPSVLGHSSHNNHEGLTLINLPTLADVVADSEGNSINSSSVIQVQDNGHTNSLGLEMDGGGHHHGLDDCSEECSEDDEEEDEEIEDSDDEEMGYIHHNQTMSQQHASMNVDQDHQQQQQQHPSSLPSCQQHARQLVRVINSNGDVNNILSQIHDIEEEIPPISSQGHPLNSNPISAIPMITGNCGMMMSDQQQQQQDGVVIGVGQNNNTSQQQQSGDPLLLGGGDPSSCSSSGHSVHGKMYVEERVVFHLKQWTESGFGNFNSCREQDLQDQQKSHQYGCAVCHIRAPHNNLQSNKDTHRHLVRGILFSFEDCIILELYPEEYNDGGGGQESRSHHPMSMSSSVANNNDKADEEAIPLTYFNSSSNSNNNNTSVMSDIVLSEQEKPSSSTLGHNTNQQQQGGGGWWEYESTTEDRVDNNINNHQQHLHHVTAVESCAINLKLTAQHFHDAQAAVEEERDTNEINNEVQQQQQQVQIEIIHENDSDINYQNHSLPSQYYTSTNMNDNHNEISTSIGAVGVENEDELPSSPIQDQSQAIATFPQSAEEEHLDNNEIIDEENCIELEIPSLPTASSDQEDEDDGPVPPPILQEEEDDVNTIAKEKVKKSNSSINKYPCPSCRKYFRVKRHLTDHVKEKHTKKENAKKLKEDCKRPGNKYTQNVASTTRHHRLKNEDKKKKIKIEQECSTTTTTTDSSNSNTESTDTVISSLATPQPDDGESEILELVLASKSSKVRKFSEKASRKLEKQAATVNDSSSSSTSIIIEEKSSLIINIASLGDEENRKEKDGNQLKPCSINKLTTSTTATSPIKINHDQNIEPASSLLLVNVLQAIKPPPKESFRCEICHRCFSQHRRLVNHAACHKPEKSSQCEQCGKKFLRRDKLLRHMFVHSEQKMFSCQVCEKKFSRRDKLSDHLKSHQTDEIYNCTVCARQFLRPDIFRQHLKMHVMDDKFQCKECLRFVTGKERLDQHMKRHEEAKASGLTLLCPLCTKYFIQAQSLKAHIRKFHPDALSQLNINQLHFGQNNNDALEEDEDHEDDNNGSGGGSGSNSNNSLGLGEEVQKKITNPSSSTSTSTPVSQALQNVMSFTKSSSKTKPKKFLNKPIVAVKKESTTENNSKLSFSCAHCSKTFSRNQTLRNHELRKHPISSLEQNNTTTTAGSKSSGETTTTSPDTCTESIEQPGKMTKKAGESLSEFDAVTKLDPKKKHTKSTNNKVKRKIVKSEQQQPSSVVDEPNPISLEQMIIRQTLPSCATLTQDLGFSNSTTFQQSETHLNPYSHHQLTLSSSTSLQHNPLQMRSLVVTGLPHHQGSIQLVNAQGQTVEIGQSSICPQQTSSFVISYPSSPSTTPSTTTMSFQP